MHITIHTPSRKDSARHGFTIVELVVVSVVIAIIMRHTVTPETIDRVNRKNAAKDLLHPEHLREAVKPHSWESPLDAEIQRLKRKSLGQ